MNYLLAQTKGRNGSLYKVISDMEVFELAGDLDNPVEYDPNHNLDEDSWFAIQEFSCKDFCLEFLTRKFVGVEYDHLPVEEYSNIQFLCSYQRGIYYFQKVSSSQLARRKYLSFSNEPKIIEDEPIIIINSFADAI
ncbi:MAG TPA: hypothetical protein VHM20_07845, partial [Gammaproteobacteria bacterium]|nr:hypothetical protein [Gammaproteobacteria bacterium]